MKALVFWSWKRPCDKSGYRQHCAFLKRTIREQESPPQSSQFLPWTKYENYFPIWRTGQLGGIGSLAGSIVILTWLRPSQGWLVTALQHCKAGWYCYSQSREAEQSLQVFDIVIVLLSEVSQTSCQEEIKSLPELEVPEKGFHPLLTLFLVCLTQMIKWSLAQSEIIHNFTQLDRLRLNKAWQLCSILQNKITSFRSLKSR